MSFRKCPGCEAVVDASKAYCPDCGTPMDEELRRNDSSEFDSLMKTQNINRTTQLRLLEQFELSSFFTPPPQDSNQPNVARSEPKANPPNEIKVKAAPPNEIKVIANPPSEIRATANPPNEIKEAQYIQIQPEAAPKKSGKRLYIGLGIGLFLFICVLIGVIILGLLYWQYSKG